MLESLTTAALSAPGGVTLVALALAIVALWRALQSGHKNRVAALEAGFAKCLKQHQRCERRNQKLVLAVLAAAEGRTAAAMDQCRNLLDTADDQDSDEEEG